MSNIIVQDFKSLQYDLPIIALSEMSAGKMECQYKSVGAQTVPSFTIGKKAVKVFMFYSASGSNGSLWTNVDPYTGEIITGQYSYTLYNGTWTQRTDYYFIISSTTVSVNKYMSASSLNIGLLCTVE